MNNEYLMKCWERSRKEPDAMIETFRRELEKKYPNSKMKEVIDRITRKLFKK